MFFLSLSACKQLKLVHNAFPNVQVRDDQQVGYCHSEEMIDQSAPESSTKEPVPPVSDGNPPTSMEAITVDGVARNVEHQPLLPDRSEGIPYPPAEEHVDLLEVSIRDLLIINIQH